MTMKKIFRERPEIKKKVYEDYPLTAKEKSCAIEKSKRDTLRFERAKRYYDQPGAEKMEYE